MKDEAPTASSSLVHLLQKMQTISFTHTSLLSLPLAVGLTETLMHQTFIITRIENSENREKLLETLRENPGGARKIENISEQLPGKIGFICYPVIPWAVMRRWSGWKGEESGWAERQGGRQGLRHGLKRRAERGKGEEKRKRWRGEVRGEMMENRGTAVGAWKEEGERTNCKWKIIVERLRWNKRKKESLKW